ncbi:MAG: hypothetical protein EBZ78_04115 [Verrucomicrobia bacterium]|nr:hypothetical protein [Verrucomicrobiota bacterium]
MGNRPLDARLFDITVNAVTNDDNGHDTFTASPVAFVPLEKLAETLTCSTRSLLRAEAKGLLRLSRPFGPGSKIYVNLVDAEKFLKNGWRIDPDHARGERLTACRRKITPTVKRKNQKRTPHMQTIPP